MLNKLFFLPILPAALSAAGLASHWLDRQPIRFEENHGQASAEYRYLGRTPQGTLALSPSGMDLLLARQTVRARLCGANPDTHLEALDPLPVRTSYFQGTDSRQWKAGIANYERVRYRAVYPGIDLVFYGRGDALEYDFVVSPGASPAAIGIDIEGSGGLRVDAAGDLVMATSAGDVRWKRPEIHQTAGGRQTDVSGGYVLAGKTVRLQIGPYDHSQPLIIDPVLSFSTYFGSSGNEAIRGMATDSAGNVYVTGSTTSTDLPANGLQKQFAGKGSTLLGVVTIGDAFVAKFSPAGSLLFLTYLGGSAEDVGSALTLDKSGNVYVTGYTDSSNFPVTSGAAQTTWGGRGGNMLIQAGDAFVAKLGPNGDQLVYSTFLGGRNDDWGSAIAIDAAGDAYITGGTLSDNLPVSSNAAQTTYKRAGTQEIFPRFDAPLLTSGDAFIAKINPAGSAILGLTYLGGSYDDMAWALTLDGAGNVYVGGNTLSTDFPTTNGAFQTKFAGSDLFNNIFFNLGDGFIAKLKGDLSAILYSTYLGGTGDDAVTAIALDSAGNAYVTGATTSQSLGTANTLQQGFKGPFAAPVADQLVGDAFVAKIAPDGKSLGFFTYLGGSSDDVGMAIALDASGNVVVTGTTQSTNFPVSTNALQAKSPLAASQVGGGGCGFLVMIDPTGKTLIYGSYFGGSSADIPTSVAIDASGNILLAGAAMSTDYPTVKPNQATYGGGSSDGFLAKFTGFTTSGGGSGGGGSTAPTVTAAGITNVASYQSGSVSPGEILAIFGSNMGPSTAALFTVSGGKIGTSLGGTAVTFDGVAAPLIYTSAIQIDAIVPYSVAGKSSTQVVVQYNNQSSTALSVPVVPAVPGLFKIGTSQGAILNQDGSVNGANNPADRGSVVVLFLTGEGQTNPAGTDGLVATSTYPKPLLPVSVTIGGQNVTPAYAGAAPYEVAGMMQVNVTVPSGITPGNSVPVTVTVGNATTPTGVTLAVK
jgi:uncharacterized protein (TIGR03437 family)